MSTQDDQTPPAKPPVAPVAPETIGPLRWRDVPHPLRLALGSVIYTAVGVLVWLALAYILTVPMFLAAHGEAFRFAWGAPGLIDTEALQRYHALRDHVLLFGALAGLVTSQVVFVLLHLNRGASAVSHARAAD